MVLHRRARMSAPFRLVRLCSCWMRCCRKVLIVPAVFVATAALLWSQPRPAQAIYDEARALVAKNDAASLHLALERYTEAQALFRTEGKPAMQVEALAARAEV